MDTMEELVHAAGDRPVAALDVDRLRARVAQRRRRRATLAIALPMLVVAVAVATISATSGTTDPARRIHTPVDPPPITWQPRTPLPRGATSVVGRPGTAIAWAPTAIWRSADLTTWDVVASLPAGLDGTPGPERFERAFTTGIGFVMTAKTTTEEHEAELWFSADGSTWQRSDQAAFRAPSTDARKKGIQSDVYDIVQQGGRLVAVGEVRTGAKNQPYGLSPCVWTSTDGITWTRRFIALGRGFDPYVGWLLPRGAGYLAGGQIDRAPAMWTTDDLVHWQRVDDAPPSNILPRATNGAYVALGYHTVRSQLVQRHRIVHEAITAPEVWQSPSGARWHRVFAVSPQKGYDDFVALGRAREALVLVRQRPHASSRVHVYTSANGRHWGEIASATDEFPPGTNLYSSAAYGDSMLLIGTVAGQRMVWQSGPG